jgi:hypothetical protein
MRKKQKLIEARPKSWPGEWQWPPDINNPEQIDKLAEIQKKIQPGEWIVAEDKITGITRCLYCDTKTDTVNYRRFTCEGCGLMYKKEVHYSSTIGQKTFVIA